MPNDGEEEKMIDIICNCGTCRYSENNKCCNENMKKNFERISAGIKEIRISSSNCPEFSEEKWAHDVE